MIALHRSHRRGMTLVELLVVAAIMMLLVFVAIPALTPTTTTRAIREAARSVDIFLGAARNQAIATGRRVGVMMERLAAQPDACVTLYQVEEPPPYLGDTYNAQLSVWLESYATPPTGLNAGDPPRLRVQDTQGVIAQNRNMVHVGDRIQFNGQGPYYTIGAPTDIQQGTTAVGSTVSSSFYCRLNSTPGTTPAWNPSFPEFRKGVPGQLCTFRIFRQPVRTAAAPLELPPGTAIDLYWSYSSSYFVVSGNSSGTSQEYYQPVTFMFDSSGAVCATYAALNGTRGPPVLDCIVSNTPILLIIGERSRVLGGTTPVKPKGQSANYPPDGLSNFWDWGPEAQQFPKKNFFNGSSLCVTIAPQTGYTSVHEVFEANGEGNLNPGESAMGGR